MEIFLLLFSLGLGVALFFRSANDRERLHKLESDYKGQLDYFKKVFADHQNELTRLRGMSLELLKAQTAVRGRLTELIESPGGVRQLAAPSHAEEVAPHVAIAPHAAPDPFAAPVDDYSATLSQPVSPPVAQIAVSPSASELASAVVSAATAAGLHTHAEAESPPDPLASQVTPGRSAPATTEEAAPPAPSESILPPLSTPPPAVQTPLAAVAETPATAAPPLKPAPSFDWETLLGVRGAAWLGAIALIIAGTLFAKYSIENDLIKPPLRIASLIFVALTALGSSEFFLRPRYTVTANAICASGVAILYAALFAAHSLYDLVGLVPTFVLMALTTVTAALLSLRYENMYIAVLGMLGGFATPLALSTGQDRPYGLFAYILMLDLGFLWVAVRRGWHRLALVNLVATMLMEAGWAGKFLSPAKMPIAVGVALVFAFLFMALPLYLRGMNDKQKRELLYGSGTAGLLPFVFAWVLATHPQYAHNWPLLFGFIGCLELGLLWVALRRWPVLALLSLLATAATHALWDLTSLTPQLMTVAVGSALILALPFWLAPWLFETVGRSSKDEPLPSQLRLTAALGGTAPLLLFCALAGQWEYSSLWIRLFGGVALSVGALLWLALRRSPVVAVTTAIFTALCLALWTGSTLQVALLAPLLGTTVGLSLLFLMPVALAQRGKADAVPIWLIRGAAVALVAALVLHCRLAGDSIYGSRWPLLFASLACMNGAVLWLGVRHSPLLVRVGLGLTILCHALWIGTSMTTAQVPLAMGLALLFGLPYLALPSLQKGQGDDKPGAGTTDATVAAVAPFVLAFYLASTPEHAQRWALLFGFVAILDGVLVTMALYRRRALLLLVAAAATSLTQLSWAATGLQASTLWGGTLCTLVLSAALGALPRLWTWRFPPPEPATTPTLPEWAGLSTLIGLALFTTELIQRGLAQPPWAFLLLTALLTALLIERTRRGGIAWTAPVGGFLLAALVQGWFVTTLPSDSTVAELLPADVLLRNLSVPLLLATVLSVAAALRTGRWRSERAGVPAPAGTPDPWARVARHSELGALLATLTALLGLVFVQSSRNVGNHPGLLFTAYMLLDVLIFGIVVRQQWTWLGLLALLITASGATQWQQEHFQPHDAITALSFLAALYLFFLSLPLLMLRALPPLRTHRSLFFTAALAGPAFFLPLYLSWVGSLGRGAIGVLPVIQAALAVVALAIVQALPQPSATEKLPADRLARRDLGHRALLAAIALGFLATAIPLQLDRQWIGVAWALEAAGVWWLYRRLPHPGLKYFGLFLFAAVTVRLIPSKALLHYHQRGLPVLNWLLYSYGVPCLGFLVGAAGLAPVEARYRTALEKTFPIGNERVPLHAVVSFAGLLLVFALINLEIADAFSPGPYTELWLTHSYARDLTRSLAWGVYAITLLIIGMGRDRKALRYFSLGMMLLTIAKVFLYDLSNVGGIYRSLSFLGLAMSLILVSLLYQRFVFQSQSRRQKTAGTAPPPSTPGGPAGPPTGDAK